MQNIKIQKKGESTNDYENARDNVTLFINVKLYKYREKQVDRLPLLKRALTSVLEQGIHERRIGRDIENEM